MMYTFATKEEQKTNKNNPHINSPHYSTNLQQAIEAAARSTECLERPICTGSKTTNILNEARQTNKAVLLSREIKLQLIILSACSTPGRDRRPITLPRPIGIG